MRTKVLPFHPCIPVTIIIDDMVYKFACSALKNLFEKRNVSLYFLVTWRKKNKHGLYHYHYGYCSNVQSKLVFQRILTTTNWTSLTFYKKNYVMENWFFLFGFGVGFEGVRFPVPDSRQPSTQTRFPGLLRAQRGRPKPPTQKLSFPLKNTSNGLVHKQKGWRKKSMFQEAPDVYLFWTVCLEGETDHFDFPQWLLELHAGSQWAVKLVWDP